MERLRRGNYLREISTIKAIMYKKLKSLSILFLILVNISCKTDASKSKIIHDENLNQKIKETNTKPFVIGVDIDSFFLNNFNLSNSFDENEMILALGKPDKLEKNLDNFEETGFPDYYIYYGKNIIWASYGHVSDVFFKEKDMKLNDVKLGDNREEIEKKFNIKTQCKFYIQLVNKSMFKLNLGIFF